MHTKHVKLKYLSSFELNYSQTKHDVLTYLGESNSQEYSYLRAPGNSWTNHLFISSKLCLFLTCLSKKTFAILSHLDILKKRRYSIKRKKETAINNWLNNEEWNHQYWTVPWENNITSGLSDQILIQMSIARFPEAFLVALKH